MIDSLREALKLRSHYKAVFGTEPGRIVLRDICKAGDVARSCFSPGKPDVTAYDNGARDLALGIMKKVFGNDDELKKQIGDMYQDQP